MMPGLVSIHTESYTTPPKPIIDKK